MTNKIPKSKLESKLSFLAYTRIVEWLYQNDGDFKSKSEWRRAFLRFLIDLSKGNFPPK